MNESFPELLVKLGHKSLNINLKINLGNCPESLKIGIYKKGFLGPMSKYVDKYATTI